MKIAVDFVGAVGTFEENKKVFHPAEQVDYYLRVLVNDHKHEVIIVHDQNSCQLSAVQDWLSTNNLSLPIINVSDIGSKLEIYISSDIGKLGLFVGIIKKLLFFNKSVGQNELRQITRVSSWWEAYEYIWEEAV